jgi:hypothetical protein
MKCPVCKQKFYEKIEGEEGTIYEGNYLCLCCMTVFDIYENVIERG